MSTLTNIAELIGIIFTKDSSKRWANTLKNKGKLLGNGRRTTLPHSEYPNIERALRVATYNMETPDLNKLVNDVATTRESSDTGLSKALYKPLSVSGQGKVE